MLEWLADRHGLPFDVVTNFSYPGHSARRMHGLPKRTGSELVDRLREAAEARDIPILTGFRATTLFTDSAGRVAGIAGTRPGGGEEQIGCRALVLACNGLWRQPRSRRETHPRNGRRALVRPFRQ